MYGLVHIRVYYVVIIIMIIMIIMIIIIIIIAFFLGWIIDYTGSYKWGIFLGGKKLTVLPSNLKQFLAYFKRKERKKELFYLTMHSNILFTVIWRQAYAI